MTEERKGIVGDKLGPRYVVKVYNPKFEVWGFLVIDNIKFGPGKGGIRMTKTVTEEEVARLARAMTLKNALAGIPFGGAKAGIQFDPKTHSPKEKKQIVEWFARELKPFLPKFYIAGPDINMTEKEMAVFVGAVKNKKAATGKPKRLGGLPHELGSTGFGVAVAARLALRQKNISLTDVSLAVEGFGNVGVFAAKFLTASGVKLVAVSDSRGTIYSPAGLDYKRLLAVKKKSGSVMNYAGGQVLPSGKVFTLPVDLLITAALPDVINKQNVNLIKARVIVEGSNIPMGQKEEEMLHSRGVLIIPDIVANSGGVISSYAEHAGYGEKEMFQMVEEKISHNVLSVLRLSQQTNQTPRAAAQILLKRRLF